MTRLAFVGPLPPAPTGIADYTADVLHLLAGGFDIDVFHDQDEVDAARLPAGCGVHRAQTLLDRHRARPYDLAVHQMGNAPAHAFVYPLLQRLPGLLVLHDLVLHHSRARMLIDTDDARVYGREPWREDLRQAAARGLAAYGDEVAYCYPEAKSLDQVHLNTVGDLLPYAYPLFRIPVEASRLTAVHNAHMAMAVAAEVDDSEVALVPMPAQRVAVGPARVAALRAGLGLAPDDFVVACFGLLTREKRIATVARAVARAAFGLPRLRLLLVGPVPDRAALDSLLDGLGLAARTVVTGRVAFGELPGHIEVADLVVHLRYPTARETSAALLRVLAQGRPVVMSALEHLDDVPDDAVVRADPADEEGEVLRAILRLAERPRALVRLGRNAAAFVAERHAPELCRAAYEKAIGRAITLPDPPPRAWPAHWRTPA